MFGKGIKMFIKIKVISFNLVALALLPAVFLHILHMLQKFNFRSQPGQDKERDQREV